MPGITGIISKTLKEKNETDLQLMVKSMLHESFYNSGIYTNEQLGVYAGWVCHEGSFSDCMPVWNEKKNVVLIFFGENFTDLELFDQLKAKHHRFDNFNASYLIHLYEERGIDFLHDLNGWFSGLLVDMREGKVFLFNDRYGMQRIFYHEGKDAFFFSSEAKALLKIGPELREVDLKCLGEYLSCNCVLENRTLFKNIFLLPGAAAWEFKPDGSFNKGCYFKPDIWENQPWLEKEFFYEKLNDTFAKVLPRYFRSNQNIGISLTGGLDTRVIMATMDMPPGKYPCYTFGGMYRDCYDVKVARKVADACQQTHQVLTLDEKFLSEFPKYAEKTIYITDGYFGIFGSYEVYLNSMAREIAPIRMTGNYGGEILRSIEGMLEASPPDENLYSSDINMHIQNAAKTVAGLYKSLCHPMTFNLFKEIPWLRNHGFVSEQSQLTPRTPYLDNDIVALMYRAPMGVRDNKKMSWRLIADGNPALAEISTDRGFKSDTKASVSTLVQLYYTFLVKAEYAYNYGMPQWLAKFDYLFRFMHFERLFLGRHKFAHFRIWYRDELANYIKALLLDERTLCRPYLNRKTVEEIVHGHTKGNRNYTTEISRLVTLELIHRLLIESNL
ncbi:MAG: asparagine synthase-related protein [Syntrophaceae bacterium]